MRWQEPTRLIFGSPEHLRLVPPLHPHPLPRQILLHHPPRLSFPLQKHARFMKDISALIVPGGPISVAGTADQCRLPGPSSVQGCCDRVYSPAPKNPNLVLDGNVEADYRRSGGRFRIYGCFEYSRGFRAYCFADLYHISAPNAPEKKTLTLSLLRNPLPIRSSPPLLPRPRLFNRVAC